MQKMLLFLFREKRNKYSKSTKRGISHIISLWKHNYIDCANMFLFCKVEKVTSIVKYKFCQTRGCLGSHKLTMLNLKCLGKVKKNTNLTAQFLLCEKHGNMSICMWFKLTQQCSLPRSTAVHRNHRCYSHLLIICIKH